MIITSKDALLVVDPQNDFCPGGAMAVAGGDEIMDGINQLSRRFREADGTIVVLQDWHPANHVSFKTVWPIHCVQGTAGAAFHTTVMETVNRANLVLRKGMNPLIDSYSGFIENDKRNSTGLAGYLSERGIERVFVVGLAYEFCVGYSAQDAANAGFEATIVKSLTRAINAPIGYGRTTVMDFEENLDGISVVETI